MPSTASLIRGWYTNTHVPALLPKQVLYFTRAFTNRAHYIKGELYALSDDRTVLIIYKPFGDNNILDGIYEVDVKAAIVGLRNGNLDKYITIPGPYARLFQGKPITNEILWDKLRFDGDVGSIVMEPGELVKFHGFVEGLNQIADKARLAINNQGLVLESEGEDHVVRVLFNGKPSGSAVASYDVRVLRSVTDIIGVRGVRLLINKQRFGLFEYTTSHGLIRAYFAPLVE